MDLGTPEDRYGSKRVSLFSLFLGSYRAEEAES